MYILGISCFYHDAAAALLEDGCLVAAAEEERFSRKKHDFGFPELAIDFCLRQAGISADQLDYVVFYEKPLPKFERILLTMLGTYPRSWRAFSEALVAWLTEKLWIKSRIVAKLGLPDDRILFADHHVAHAASAFFCSPFEEAAIITVDGVGEWTTTTVGSGRASWDGGGENRIQLDRELRFPHSLGLLYSAFTAFLGFEVNEGEYKVMGMAPYGQPRYEDKVRETVNVRDDGSFSLNMDYFSYHYSHKRTYSDRFVSLFGPPRHPGADFVTPDMPEATTASQEQLDSCQYYADVAASIQQVTEELLLGLARHAHEQTGMRCLCLAGGVALNSVANGRILRETPFDDLYIQPAAGDSGGALGAALYVYHVVLGQPRRFVMEHAYWGAQYDTAQVREFLEAQSTPYRHMPDAEQLIDWTASALEKGLVVGWFQDRFEWGPRALGNRSILADPRSESMKGIVNSKIKFREPFRPFAPAVLEERAGEYFELTSPQTCYPARFMLLVAGVKKDKQAIIPAVTHVGGTGRLQTVRREINPRYYRLIERFGERTGVPVVLNTSFNRRGEPIVNSPADAWATFMGSGIDALVIGDFVVTKAEQAPSETA
jgi:carbamoyltransferase